MKKFKDYVKLREVSAMNIGKDIMGGASGISLDSKTEGALQAVLEAFELLLDARPNMVISWLKKTSQTIPEVSNQIDQILAQHDFESLPDLKGAIRKAGRKLGSAIKKGLGDQGSNDNVLSPNAADSFKGENYLVETSAVCARCGKEGRASRFDINAGKAKCHDCGGFMNMAEPKKKKKEVVKESYRGLTVASRKQALDAWKIAMAKLGKRKKFNSSLVNEKEITKWEGELASLGLKLPPLEYGDELENWLYDEN